MKVAIIGYGFVGKALENGLKKNVKTFLVDPNLNTDTNDLKDFEPDIVFVCVPTPMNDDGTQNIQILKTEVNKLYEFNNSALIVIKSTVLPNYLSEIAKKIPKIVYNPEFLRENFSNEDFINSNLIIFGGNEVSTKNLGKFYRNHTKCVHTEYQYTDLISASLIKYSINTFLSTKVIFFNELYKIFNNSNTHETWENFIEIMAIDPRIGASHMQVPGHDGKLGFGGPCFPKDNNALLEYSKQLEAPFHLLDACVTINNAIRNKYNNLSQREKDQNINFNSKIEKTNSGDIL